MTAENNVSPLVKPIEVEIKRPVETPPSQTKIEFVDFSFYYGKFKALGKINMQIPANQITAIIGPSGCGKSTLLRSVNRMNDLVASAKAVGQILFDGDNILDSSVDVVNIRRKIGMVFQRPNPFPKSIYDNVAYGPKLYGIGKRQGLDEIVQDALKQAALWEEVKDKLNLSAMALSGGQQQRLCIARALAVQPEVILMDEPASALDPVATLKIEELMQALKETYTIIIVTHNMQQAARVSDLTAFMMIDDPQTRTGILVEFGPTAQIFTNPKNKQTEDYVTGRFG
ncbi:MAG: phosphate ABC transporter ATP-binding protein [Anaerolineales bacterium]|nr:phosphate ABC transporter ATP-binding protein [Anaerolineae bacterium]PWB55767.1 MAG: phosphate ABC transporter ATP-binding protein [Anaerolineales bacterium]